MWALPALLTLALAAAGLLSPAAALPTADVEAQQLFEEYHEWRLRDDPEYATRQGRHEYDHLLTARSVAAEASRYTTSETYLKDVDRLMEKPTSFEIGTSLLVLREHLRDFQAGYRQTGYLLAVDSGQGDPAVRLAGLAEWMPFTTAADFERWLSRLSALPQQLDELRQLLQLGVQRGVTAHLLTVQQLPDRLRAHNGSVEETTFFRPFLNMPDAVDEAERQKLADRAHQVIRQDVLEPLLEFADFVETEYLDSARPSMAASSLGPEFYQACLAKFTSTNVSADEAHQIGLDEVERVQKEIGEVVLATGFRGSPAEFDRQLADDPSHWIHDAETLAAELGLIIDDRLQPAVEAALGVPSRRRLVLEPAAAALDGAEFARYRGAAPGGSQPARLLLGRPAGGGRVARFQLLAGALGEVAPGRHLRRARLLDAALPAFRRAPDDSAATGVAPSGWTQDAALADGWALHAVSLAGELGLQEAPLERLGRLRAEALCAARLVVDTGVHARNWSRADAERYLSETAALPAAAAAAELSRVVTSPGRAAGCTAGAVRLRQLRRLLTGRLGAGGDTRRAFDRLVLDCPGPLAAVERCVRHQVELRTQARPAEAATAAAAGPLAPILTLILTAAAAAAAAASAAR